MYGHVLSPETLVWLTLVTSGNTNTRVTHGAARVLIISSDASWRNKTHEERRQHEKMAFHRHLYNQCLLSIAAGLCRLSFFNVCFIIQERRLQSLRDQNIVVVGGALCLDLDSSLSECSRSQAVRPEGSGPGLSTASPLSLVSTQPLLVTTETQPRAHQTTVRQCGYHIDTGGE